MSSVGIFYQQVSYERLIPFLKSLLLIMLFRPSDIHSSQNITLTSAEADVAKRLQYTLTNFITQKNNWH